MTEPPRRRRLSAQRRRALQLLANSQSGITETLLFGHGVTPHMLGHLLRGGLATIQREMIKSGDRTIEIGSITITDAGQRALEGMVERKLPRRIYLPDELQARQQRRLVRRRRGAGRGRDREGGD
jgi:hypothetical protein